MVVCVCERERVRESRIDREPQRYDIFSWRYISRELCFVLLSREIDTGRALNPELPDLLFWQAPKTAWLFIAYCWLWWLTASSVGVENFCPYIFFKCQRNYSYTILLTQFTWNFCCPLFTLRHFWKICFQIYKHRSICNIHMLKKSYAADKVFIRC